METLEFIREKFRTYYLKNAEKLKLPSAFTQREFGFIPFRLEKSMVRHRGFQTPDEFSDFIKNFVPADIYYSSAYYENPSRERMTEKGWQGADLVFDIDCDHIHTACKKKHDKWMCTNCGKVEFGEKPKFCPKCKSERINEDTWICEECLEIAKKETIKLAGILEEDFGFQEECMHIVFSGHRGYHIHISEERVRKATENLKKAMRDFSQKDLSSWF